MTSTAPNDEQGTTKPQTHQGDLANLPAALEPLKEMEHWVCWNWEWRVKNGIGKWSKPPRQPKEPGRYAMNNAPKTWGTYAQAVTAWQAGKCDGIGFNLSRTSFGAFDLDKCRDPQTGAIHPEAMKIVERCGSYTEVTPSGTGLRVIGTSNGGAKVHRKQKIPNAAMEVESYVGAERYITISASALEGGVEQLADIGPVIDDVVAELDNAKAGSSNGSGIDEEWRKPFEDWRKAHPDRQYASDFEIWAELNDSAGPKDFSTDDSRLPARLMKVLRNDPPAKDLSSAFHGAVNSLYELGWSVTRIESYIENAPVVPERYAGRLRQEIARCLFNAERERAFKKAREADEDKEKTPQPLAWLDMSNWDIEWVPERQWAILGRVPLRQVGLFSGEGGTGKSIIELMKNIAHVRHASAVRR